MKALECNDECVVAARVEGDVMEVRMWGFRTPRASAVPEKAETGLSLQANMALSLLVPEY